MRIRITIDSAAASARLRRWGDEFRVEARAAVRRALTAQAAEIKVDVRKHVAASLKVVKTKFLSGFSVRIIDRDKSRLPALYVSSGIPWAGIQEFGGTINGKLLIPLYGRVGRKQFAALVAQLLASGNAYFRKDAKGNVLLMAKNMQAQAPLLRGFKSRYRKAEGIKGLKRGADIPIAVLVAKVTLKKRLDIEALVVSHVPRIAIAIEQQIGALG